MKILHLIDSFTYGGSAKQVRLLGPAFADGATSVEVCCLGPTTPWLDSLRNRGVIVHALDWTRWFDPSVLWNLRAILHEAAPDLIHVWRLPALRTLAIAAGQFLPRVVLSDAKGELTWWDRRLLEQVKCVAIANATDGERLVGRGVNSARLRLVTPLVEAAAPQDAPDAAAIVCVGRLERDHGFRNAIWAFDFLRFVWPDLSLQLVGAGSQRAALAALATGLQADRLVQFLDDQDATDVLRSARIVWVPSIANCGQQTALEAMALGKPVIASDVPCLRELIDDGVNGMLVPPGDVVQLARRTRTLLQDPALRDQLCAAAQRTVASRFALADAVAAWRTVYQGAAA